MTRSIEDIQREIRERDEELGRHVERSFVLQLTPQEADDLLHAVAFYQPAMHEPHEVFVRRYGAFQTFTRQVRTQLGRRTSP